MFTEQQLKLIKFLSSYQKKQYTTLAICEILAFNYDELRDKSEGFSVNPIKGLEKEVTKAIYLN
jgi:hypothetical protein